MTTTPLPMTEVMCGYRTPDGRQPELEDLVAADDGVAGVVAALVADDHRDCSARKSVVLPLPSSPHCSPTITVAGISQRERKPP